MNACETSRFLRINLIDGRYMFAQKKHRQGKNFKTKIRYDHFFAYIDIKVY